MRKHVSHGAIDLGVTAAALFVVEIPLSPIQVSTKPWRMRDAFSRLRASQVIAPMVPGMKRNRYEK